MYELITRYFLVRFAKMRKAAVNFLMFVCVCPSVRLSFCPSLILSVSYSVRLSFCLSLLLSVSHSVRLSFCPSLILSVSHSVRLSFCPSLILSKRALQHKPKGKGHRGSPRKRWKNRLHLSPYYSDQQMHNTHIYI